METQTKHPADLQDLQDLMNVTMAPPQRPSAMDYPKYSKETSALSEALAKAQGELENAEKNSRNDHFKNKFADLAANLNVGRGPLSKNGIAVTQFPVMLIEGWHLSTRMLHLSGQFQETVCPLPMEKDNAQGFGGSMTYMRRYSYAAAVGIGQEDDDGNSASGVGQDGNGNGGSKPVSKPASPPPKPPAPKSPTDAQVNRLYALAKTAKWDEAMLNEIKAAFEITKWRDLTMDKYTWTCEQIEKGMQPEGMAAFINGQKANAHNENPGGPQ